MFSGSDYLFTQGLYGIGSFNGETFINDLKLVRIAVMRRSDPEVLMEKHGRPVLIWVRMHFNPVSCK